MSLFHLEMDDSSLVGQFPGNLGGGAPANIGVHIFHSNYPDMRCIQRMIYSQGKCWSWFTTTIFWWFIWQFCLFRKFYYDQKKKSSSRLSGGLCCCVSFWFWQLWPEKKNSSRLSGGLCCCVSFWFWRLRPEIKKVLVVCLVGCAVVSVFGSGNYDRKNKKF